MSILASSSSLRLVTRILIAFAWCCCFGWFPGTTFPSYAHEAPPLSISELVRSVRPSVVSIYMRGLLNPAQSTTASSGLPKIYEQVGTGSIVSADGYIVTNKHVVNNAYHVEVTLYDGTHVRAEVVAVARNFDLAVLKIDKTGLAPVKIGDSDQLKVGETVIAIGNPLGLKQTVSVGVVSALHRVMGFGDFDDLIQTDAAINPGNSGGPLFNVRGEVVGVNQAIYTIGEAKGSIGLGFAITSNEAYTVIELLRSTGTDQGVLGVSVQTLTPDLATASSSSSVAGVLITDVLPESAASKVGLKVGDIISKFAGEVIDDTSELNRLVAVSAKTTKSLSYEREGKEITVSVFIPEVSEPTIIRGQLPAPEIKSTRDAGLVLSSNEDGDVLVTSVVEDSVADVTGFKAGDKVLAVQNANVGKISDFNAAIGAAIANRLGGVRVLVSGRKGRRWVYLALGD
jgi:serine protease Do